MATLDQKLEHCQEQLTTLKASEKKARAGLATLDAKPRLSDLRRDLGRLEEEQKAIQARLTALRDDDSVSISPAERVKLEQEWKQWQHHARVRRRICRDLWMRCSEVLPDNMTSQELWVRVSVHQGHSAYLPNDSLGIFGA